MNNIDRILDDFEEYCTNEIVSGKARSYKLAIKYLCDYLKISYEAKCITFNSLEQLQKEVNRSKQGCTITS